MSSRESQPATHALNGAVIALTGGSGFVGSRVAAQMAALGATVRAVVRTVGNHPGLGSSRITQIVGDFVDPQLAAEACRGADFVVHSAATAGPDLEAVRRVNATGTANLAAAARAAGCRRFIHISTVSVYATPDPAGDYDETAGLKTDGEPYGLTKAEAERGLEPEMRRGLPVVILRPGAILGVHPTSTWAVRIPNRIRQGEFPLHDNGRRGCTSRILSPRSNSGCCGPKRRIGSTTLSTATGPGANTSTTCAAGFPMRRPRRRRKLPPIRAN
jgi:nucleoside-diphosphate-sugar epimerase